MFHRRTFVFPLIFPIFGWWFYISFPFHYLQIRVTSRELCSTSYPIHGPLSGVRDIIPCYYCFSFHIETRNSTVTSKLLIYYIAAYCNVLVINKNFNTRYFNFYCKQNGISLSDNLLYLQNVLYWPEDDRLRSKHVAVMWHDCVYNIIVPT